MGTGVDRGGGPGERLRGAALAVLTAAGCACPPPEEHPPTGCAPSSIEIEYYVGSSSVQRACLPVPDDIEQTWTYVSGPVAPPHDCRFEGITAGAGSYRDPLSISMDVPNDVFAHTCGAQMDVRLGGDSICPASLYDCVSGRCSFDITQAGSPGSDVTARLHAPCTLQPYATSSTSHVVTVQSLVLHGQLVARTHEYGLENFEGGLYTVSQRCPEHR